MNEFDQEVVKARRQFFLTAGAIGCFLLFPAFFLPLFPFIKSRTLQILLSQLLTHGCTILFIVLYSKHCEPQKPLLETLNLQGTPACKPLKVLQLFAVMFLLTSAATLFVQTLSNLLALNLPTQAITQEAQNCTWWTFIVIVFSSLILAPLAEEMLFRGVLFNAFQKLLGKHGAMIGVSLLFALLHWNMLAFFSLFLMGIMLQKAVEQTGTLRTAVWMHLLNNLVSVIYLLILRLYGSGI